MKKEFWDSLFNELEATSDTEWAAFVQEFDAKHIGNINMHKEPFTDNETGIFFSDKSIRKLYS